MLWVRPASAAPPGLRIPSGGEFRGLTPTAILCRRSAAENLVVAPVSWMHAVAVLGAFHGFWQNRPSLPLRNDAWGHRETVMSEPTPSTIDTGTRVAAWGDYLSLLVRMQLAARWSARIDVSGIVQQTLLDAMKSALPESDEELLVFLRRILANNLRDELRRHSRARRDVRREIPLDDLLEQSSQRIEGWLAADTSTPSARMSRTEDLCRLAAALASLPDDQRLVVELHHLQGLPLAATAERLGRTKEATSALMYRALKKLRERMDRMGG